jgi:hypothetical protein
MDRLDLSTADEQAFGRAKALITKARHALAKEPQNLKDAIALLTRLRKEIYEDLNQVQHEEMAIRAARSLEASDLADHEVEWHWNPRQGGTDQEPDLRGIVDGQIVVSAEITTSERPVGTIDGRMKTTLDKLSTLPGQKLYCVRSVEMDKRAKTKVNNARYHIEVRRI